MSCGLIVKRCADAVLYHTVYCNPPPVNSILVFTTVNGQLKAAATPRATPPVMKASVFVSFFPEPSSACTQVQFTIMPRMTNSIVMLHELACPRERILEARQKLLHRIDCSRDFSCRRKNASFRLSIAHICIPSPTLSLAIVGPVPLHNALEHEEVQQSNRSHLIPP